MTTPSDPSDPLAELARREGVPSALAAARDAVDGLLRDRGMRRTAPADTVEALLRGAVASATLEGSGDGLEDVRAGRAGSTSSAAQRVSGELLGLLPVWRRSPVQVLARLHALATDATDPSRGRPSSASGARRLQGVGELVLAGSRAPAMVQAAVVHAEVLTAGAFGGRDGLVARAVERLVLVHTGVDPASVTVPEAGHARSARAYAVALAGYRDASPGGVVGWLLHCAAAYAHGAEVSPLADVHRPG